MPTASPGRTALRNQGCRGLFFPGFHHPSVPSNFRLPFLAKILHLQYSSALRDLVALIPSARGHSVWSASVKDFDHTIDREVPHAPQMGTRYTPNFVPQPP
jgi:hypothetical protein